MRRDTSRAVTREQRRLVARSRFGGLGVFPRYLERGTSLEDSRFEIRGKLKHPATIRVSQGNHPTCRLVWAVLSGMIAQMEHNDRFVLRFDCCNGVPIVVPGGTTYITVIYKSVFGTQQERAASE
jgi:hypothetical protein